MPKIEQIKVSGPFKAEPVLSTEDYQEILRIVKHMVHVMELSPHAFFSMGEEDLRSHFLVQLNGAFQGQNSNTIILDARSAARFNGTAPEPRPGHMPGAINIPFTELLEAGKLKPASETNDPAHQRALACQKSDKTLTPKPSPIEPPRGYTSFTFRPRGPART